MPKTAPAKKTPVPAPAPATPTRMLTENQFFVAVADKAGCNKSAIEPIFAAIIGVAATELKRHGKVKIPGLAICTLRRVAARPEQPGVNPFNHEAITIKAKPASCKVILKPVGGFGDSAT